MFLFIPRHPDNPDTTYDDCPFLSIRQQVSRPGDWIELLAVISRILRRLATWALETLKLALCYTLGRPSS
jgi:hypothetical protein